MTSSANKAVLPLLAACAVFLAVPAFAGKTDMQTLNVAPAKNTEAPAKADYRALENAGLYSSASEGSLGKDLWKGIKRSDLLKLMEDMPVESNDPTVQRLIFGALLSETDSTMINNDVPPEPGHDLLTLRLEKLIQAGAYKQAQDLYSSFDEVEPYHERLARAGILAMLLNGEKSLACVEAETVKGAFSDSEFIAQILAFCDVTLSDTPSAESKDIMAGLKLRHQDILINDGAALAYNTESFGGLSLIEKAFLASEGKISFENSTIKDANAIPPTHLRILLDSDSLSPQNRFMLTAAAENWGLAAPGELKDIYKAALPPSGGDPSTYQVGDTAQDWEKIALYYTIAANAETDEAQWDAIKNGLNLGNRYGIGALKPYADLLAKTQPADASEDQLETAVRVLNTTGKPLPKQWSERILQMPMTSEKDQLNQRVYALHTVAELSQNNGKVAPQNPDTNDNTPYPPGTRGGYLLKNIIENVDKPETNSDNAGRIYEKDYGLTFKQDYVMPSTVVWNHLLEAGQSKNAGETVLLSASVLQVADLGKIYPGLLNDVRTGLSDVGLTDISTNLAISAVLGNIQKN
jgi:hypothetical protein